MTAEEDWKKEREERLDRERLERARDDEMYPLMLEDLKRRLAVQGLHDDWARAAVQHLSGAGAKRWEAMLSLVQGLGVSVTSEMAPRVYREACALVSAFEEGEEKRNDEPR